MSACLPIAGVSEVSDQDLLTFFRKEFLLFCFLVSQVGALEIWASEGLGAEKFVFSRWMLPVTGVGWPGAHHRGS